MPDSTMLWGKLPPSFSILRKQCKLWDSLLRPYACVGIYPQRHDWYREALRSAPDTISAG